MLFRKRCEGGPAEPGFRAVLGLNQTDGLRDFRQMKSAYELAMERLQKQAPTVKLSSAQKAELAELESQYAARVAQREIGLKDEITKAESHGDVEEANKLRAQLAQERAKLQAELEEKKEHVRRAK